MVEVYCQKRISPVKEEGLPVEKGESFLILRKQREGHELVYIARKKGLVGEVPVAEMGDTKLPKWFKMYDRQKTDEVLMRDGVRDGDFILRPAVRGKDGEFSASVRFRGHVHHFKLAVSRDSDSWTTNGHTVSTLQEFVKKFQKTHLVSGKKEKMTLSADADTSIVTVIDPDDYNEDEYEDYYDGDNEGEYENE